MESIQNFQPYKQLYLEHRVSSITDITDIRWRDWFKNSIVSGIKTNKKPNYKLKEKIVFLKYLKNIKSGIIRKNFSITSALELSSFDFESFFIACKLSGKAIIIITASMSATVWL